MRGQGGGDEPQPAAPLPGPSLPRAAKPGPAGSIARRLTPTRGCPHPWAPWPRASASHSEGDIQIAVRWQPMRGEGRGLAPRRSHGELH